MKNKAVEKIKAKITSSSHIINSLGKENICAPNSGLFYFLNFTRKTT